jgi:hypothetical protein
MAMKSKSFWLRGLEAALTEFIAKPKVRLTRELCEEIIQVGGVYRFRKILGCYGQYYDHLRCGRCSLYRNGSLAKKNIAVCEHDDFYEAFTNVILDKINRTTMAHLHLVAIEWKAALEGLDSRFKPNSPKTTRKKK